LLGFTLTIEIGAWRVKFWRVQFQKEVVDYFVFLPRVDDCGCESEESTVNCDVVVAQPLKCRHTLEVKTQSKKVLKNDER